MGNPVIIVGAHALGKVALEIFQQHNRMIYGFLDDDPVLQGTSIHHVPVLGSTSEAHYLDLIGKDCDVFITVTQHVHRQRLIQMICEQKQIIPINALHTSTTIASSAVLGYGNLVNAQVSLGVDSTLGNHGIFHAQATIEHDAVIQDFVQVGAGSVVGAGVTLHERVFVGAGATIVAGVQVGASARIGAGSVVLADVKPGETVLGNPAMPIKDMHVVGKRNEPRS